MLVTAAALVSLHDTQKPELRITLWGNLVFYTGGERVKEWNDAGNHKEPAEEEKVKMEREKIHRKKKNIARGTTVVHHSFLLENIQIFKFDPNN